MLPAGSFAQAIQNAVADDDSHHRRAATVG